jgi:hypothetical protein
MQEAGYFAGRRGDVGAGQILAKRPPQIRVATQTPGDRLGVEKADHLRDRWITPGILEALKPGRMQGHGGTEEVSG